MHLQRGQQPKTLHQLSDAWLEILEDLDDPTTQWAFLQRERYEEGWRFQDPAVQWRERGVEGEPWHDYSPLSPSASTTDSPASPFRAPEDAKGATRSRDAQSSREHASQESPPIQGPRLTESQQTAIDALASETLRQTGQVSGRVLRLQGVPIDAVAPTLPAGLIECSMRPPHENYQITLEGMLESQFRESFAECIGDILAFLKQSLRGDPEMSSITSAALQAFRGDTDASSTALLLAALRLTRLVGSGSYSSAGFSFALPHDIEAVLRCRDLSDLRVRDAALRERDATLREQHAVGVVVEHRAIDADRRSPAQPRVVSPGHPTRDIGGAVLNVDDADRGASQRTQPQQHAGVPRFLPTIAFALGVGALATMVWLVVEIPEPTTRQFLVFRTIVALGGAAFATALTGFISLQSPLPGRGYVVAGGSLAVFIILYFATPALDLVEKPALSATGNQTDDVADPISSEQDSSDSAGVTPAETTKQVAQEEAVSRELERILTRDRDGDPLYWAAITKLREPSVRESAASTLAQVVVDGNKPVRCRALLALIDVLRGRTGETVDVTAAIRKLGRQALEFSVECDGEKFEDVVFSEIRFVNSSFRRATFASVSFAGSEITHVGFHGARFFDTDFSSARFMEVRFNGADLSSDSPTVRFANSELRHASVIFDGATMNSGTVSALVAAGAHLHSAICVPAHDLEGCRRAFLGGSEITPPEACGEVVHGPILMGPDRNHCARSYEGVAFAPGFTG